MYLRTPRLHGLLALNFTIAAGSAMVIVNTVVLVQSGFGLSQQATAVALALFGGGSMLMAVLLPKLLDRYPDRRVMFTGAALIAAGMLLGAAAARRFESLLILRAGCRLLAGADAFGAFAAALGPARRPAYLVRGAVRAFACVLARDLSSAGCVEDPESAAPPS